MRYEDSSTRSVIRHAEPRHLVDLAAEAIFDEGAPVAARLVNLSRHGFRLVLPGRYEAGATFRLEVAGWPRLAARVVWNDAGRIGCLFATPPEPKVFTTMCRAASGFDRDNFGGRDRAQYADIFPSRHPGLDPGSRCLARAEKK